MEINNIIGLPIKYKDFDFLDERLFLSQVIMTDNFGKVKKDERFDELCINFNSGLITATRINLPEKVEVIKQKFTLIPQNLES